MNPFELALEATTRAGLSHLSDIVGYLNIYGSELLTFDEDRLASVLSAGGLIEFCDADEFRVLVACFMQMKPDAVRLALLAPCAIIPLTPHAFAALGELLLLFCRRIGSQGHKSVHWQQCARACAGGVGHVGGGGSGKAGAALSLETNFFKPKNHKPQTANYKSHAANHTPHTSYHIPQTANLHSLPGAVAAVGMHEGQKRVQTAAARAGHVTTDIDAITITIIITSNHHHDP
jgi:hypothetical protein